MSAAYLEFTTGAEPNVHNPIKIDKTKTIAHDHGLIHRGSAISKATPDPRICISKPMNMWECTQRTIAQGRQLLLGRAYYGIATSTVDEDDDGYRTQALKSA